MLAVVVVAVVVMVVVVGMEVVAGSVRKLLPGCSCTTTAAVPSSNCRSFVSRATEISWLK